MTRAAEAGFMTAAARLPSLYDLEVEADRLASLLEDMVDPEAVADTEALMALTDQMMIEKVESYIAVIRTFDSMAAVRKGEADRLRDRAKQAEAHAEFLRGRLLTHLRQTGRQRIETSKFSVSLRQNPPHVDVLDAAQVPGQYQRTTVNVSVDKKHILDDFKRDGAIPPGCSIERSDSLRIS